MQHQKHRETQSQYQRFASDVQMAARYGVSRASIWRWAAKGILPQPIQISPGCTRWNLEAVEERDAKREQAATAEMADSPAETPRSASEQYLDRDELECRRCGWRWHTDEPESTCPNCPPQA